ncbi:MAG TPA: PH domain-containing protein [Gemmatimonadaceae bacterium]|nr:PH domain-containing protein [Gemmatimonadaceae bacterium]
MSLPQLIFIIVAVSAVQLVEGTFGAAGTAAAFSGLGAIGLVATAFNERRGARLRDTLASLEPAARDEVLVRLENSEMRAHAVHDLGIAAPRVPLRRPLESFACSESQARTMRWGTRLWLVLGTFLVLDYASDQLLGRAIFFSASLSWWESIGIVLIWVAGTALSWWLARGSRAVVRVSDAALELECPGRRTRRIAWEEVTAVRFGGFPRRLRVASGAERIVVHDTIQGYGRLLNITLSRLPDGVVARAG